jgi:SAM-dependent methyltransferase
MSQDNSRGYDSWAHIYDLLYEHSFPDNQYRRFTETHLSLIPSDAHRVLDAGAGTGRLTVPLAKRGSKVTALEPSASMLASLRQNAEREGVGHMITEVQMTLEDADVAASIGGGHDCAICVFTTIHHVLTADNLRSAFANLASSLSAGGKALIGVHPAGFMDRFQHGSFRNVVIPELGGAVRWGQFYDRQPGQPLAYARCEITLPSGQQYLDRFAVYPWTLDEVRSAASNAGLRYVRTHDAMVEQVLEFCR